MSTEVGLFCSNCGAKYLTNTAGSSSLPCACGASFVGSVVFEPGEDGRLRTDWEIALDPEDDESSLHV